MENLINLTNEQAAIIYKKNYWDVIRADEISNASLAYAIYDFNVNAGGNAIIVLQQALNQMGACISVDGKIGTQTLNAINSCNPLELFNNFQDRRKQYYQSLINNNPVLQKYEDGWNNRVDSIIYYP